MLSAISPNWFANHAFNDAVPTLRECCMVLKSPDMKILSLCPLLALLIFLAALLSTVCQASLLLAGTEDWVD